MRKPFVQKNFILEKTGTNLQNPILQNGILLLKNGYTIMQKISNYAKTF